MNILFFTELDISPYTGGIERLTLNLVKELNARKHNCFLGYFVPSSNGSSDDFAGKYLLSEKDLTVQLKNILQENRINTCVINISSKHYLYFFAPILYSLTRELNIKVIYGFYNMPGFELQGVKMNLAFYRLLHGGWDSNTRNGLIAYLTGKLGMNGFIKKKLGRKLQIGIYSDTVVLLSEKYISQYLSLTGNNSDLKFEAIGNPLSYSQNIDKDLIPQKEKLVVHVARYDNQFKQQTVALKIWKMIEASGAYDDWKFLMIGYGQDESYVRREAKRLKLRNFEMQGMQDPTMNLTKASICMNTSAFEGLPMILLDAQQFGVVPLSFDSYAAVSDVIEDGENGFIVPNNDLKSYAERLMFLMNNKEQREQMALKGLESCCRFSKDVIVSKWEKLMQNN